MKNVLAAALFLVPTIALADNHGPIAELPYCGDTDSLAAHMSEPECLVWDGDIPARPDPAPTHFVDGHELPMNTIVVDEPLSGRALSIIASQRFGHRDAVAIIVPETRVMRHTVLRRATHALARELVASAWQPPPRRQRPRTACCRSHGSRQPAAGSQLDRNAG